MPTQRAVPESYYFSGQGRFAIGERNATTGRPENVYYTGNATALEITVNVSKNEHKESMSGERAVDLVIVTEKTATFNLTLESLSLKNLALGLWGDVSNPVGGAVVDEPHTAVAGGVSVLDKQNVSDVVVTLVSGGTTVAATQYEVDPEFGTIYWKDATEVATPTTGAVEISYTAGTVERLDAMTGIAPPERFCRFEGLNTINGDLVLVEIPRAAFEPLQNLGLINEEVANFQVTGTILQDPLITSGSKFFRQTRIAALP